MTSPTHAPAPESGSGPRFDACFTALKQWRDTLVREGRLPLGGLKDTHLKTAIIRGRRDARVIITMLPAAYGHVAPDMVEVIMSVDARSTAPGQASPTQSAPTQSAPTQLPPPGPAAQPIYQAPGPYRPPQQTAPQQPAQNQSAQNGTPHRSAPYQPAPQQSAPQQPAPQQPTPQQPAPQPSAPHHQPSGPAFTASAPTQPAYRPPASAASAAERPVMPPSASPLPASPPPSAGPTQPRAAAPSQPRVATPMPGPDPLTPPPLAARPVAAAPKVRTEEQMAELQLRAQDFAPLDFSEEIGEPGTLRTRLAGGIVTLSWDKLPELTLGSLYRVVSADDQPGWAPEYGELIDITSDLTTADDREFASAVRYYQVWRNSGTSWHEAVSSQPRLHAQASIVVPIQGLTLREDGGRVIGQWSVYPGVNRVHVYRIPIERAAQAGQDPQFLIATEDPNLHGFIDRDAARGKRFLYRFYAEASVEGVARLSAAVGQTIAVSALLSPVTDLTAHGHGTVEDWMFDLTWSDPPAGRVAIYRTQAPPSPGLGDEARDEAALVHGGLRPDDRLAHPTHVLAAGRTGMREVPGPRGWDRVYFTPVTLIEGKAMVGPSAAQVVIPEPDELVVVERTQYQMLKFGWPGDAASVAIGLSHPQETAMTPQEGAAYWEVSRDTYERLGAFRFPTRLPSSGCSVHVAGMSFVNRERVYGTAAVTQYLGLLRMSYSVELKRTLLQRPERLILRMAADIDLRNCPPFVCVFNETRLPLHHKDGEPLPVSLNSDDAPAAALQFRPTRLAPPPVEPATFRVPVRGRVGYVRVFADLPPEVLRRVALLDPPIGSLVVGSA